MTRWLSEDEQRHWRAWLAASLLLQDRLNRDLQEQHGLTMADYEILVRLSEAPDRRMRMSDLASTTLSSRSRLSHQIDRMVRAGLVEREACVADRRGAFAVLTDHGWETLVAAAPDHVESVRQHLIDPLTPQEFAGLGVACVKVADQLGGLPGLTTTD
jgi:DNA-binding MarR family transcriptional regulator